MQTTIFLDRDGVINRKAADGEYVTRWQDFAFLPGALDGMQLLHASGHRTVIVTNQRGVARGHMSDADLSDIHDRMLDRIEQAGGGRPRVYACTHEIDTCDCRKPLPGLFLQAQADDPAIAFSRSVVVGDGLADLQAAERLGARAILIAPAGADPAVAAVSRGDVRVEQVTSSLLEAARALA